VARLSNDKPSAIFRVRGSFGASQASQSSQELIISQAGGTIAQLGIAIEPLADVTNQISNLPSANKSVADPVVLAESIGKHLVNYLSSFAEVAPGGQTYVPMNAVSRWYDSFMSKVRAGGISFLEKQE
jgi:protein Hikeshi